VVGDDGLGVLTLAGGVPHLPGVADHGRHGGVDDDVRRHMEVGDAPVGVDHGDGRAGVERRLNVGLDGGPLLLRQLAEGGEHAGQPVVGVGADPLQDGSVLGEDVGEEDLHGVTEEDRVRDLHHRGLEVEREQHVLFLGGGDLPLQEGSQGRSAHDGGVEDLAGLEAEGGPQLCHGAVFGHQLDLRLGGAADGDGPLVGPEVAAVHGGHMGLRIRRPRPHRMRVPAGVALHRGGGAPVGVPFPENGVDGAARHLLVAGLDLPLLCRGRLVGVVGKVVPLGLELGDGGLQLGDGGADVRELDDVGLGRLGQRAQLGQRVADPLLLRQPVREIGQDAPRQRDVAALDGHAGRRPEGRDDR
jgi:hypothetical protein